MRHCLNVTLAPCVEVRIRQKLRGRRENKGNTPENKEGIKESGEGAMTDQETWYCTGSTYYRLSPNAQGTAKPGTTDCQKDYQRLFLLLSPPSLLHPLAFSFSPSCTLSSFFIHCACRNLLQCHPRGKLHNEDPSFFDTNLALDDVAEREEVLHTHTHTLGSCPSLPGSLKKANLLTLNNFLSSQLELC